MHRQTINKYFFSSIRWNFLDACVYQLLLTGHYLALFLVTSPAFFGKIGALFSAIFLLATVANAGLDSTLSAFFKQVSYSRIIMQKIIMRHLGVSCCLALLLGVAVLFGVPWYSALLAPYSPIVVVAIIGTIICECIKKNLRMLLQLALRSHQVAIIESATIVGYVIWVWGIYYTKQTLDVPTLFIPLFFCWLCATLASSICVYSYYVSLPENRDTANELITHKLIIKNRFLNLLNQLVHQFFSSNFLVPFFALRGGFAMAGMLKLACYISHGCTSALQKIVGFSATTIFAHTINTSSKNMRHAFFLVQRTLIYGILSLLTIVGLSSLALGISGLQNILHNFPPLTLLALIFCIQLSEIFFTGLERFLITQKKAHILLLLNSSVTSLFALVLFCTPHSSLCTTVSLLMAIRIGAYLLLRTYVFQTIAQKKSLFISMKSLVYSSLVIGTVFFMIHILL